MRVRIHGFTLIELMIIVAVVGVLASIAYPSYQSFVLKSRRAEALGLLQRAQLAQEKYRLNHSTYADTSVVLTDAAFGGLCVVVGGKCMSENQRYELTSTTDSSTSAHSYVLTAAVAGAQAKDTACQSITVTQTTGAVTHGSSPSADCWRK